MSNEHPVQNLMKSAMENLKDMVDVNTVVGDTVETKDGSYIIPISRVTFGFAAGGSEFGEANNNESSSPQYPFGGGSGAGVSVKPVAFLVVRNDSIRLLPVQQDTTYDRIVDTVPQVIDMIKDVFKKNSSDSNDSSRDILPNDIDSCDCSCHLEK